jgi:hypothetical protein
MRTTRKIRRTLGVGYGAEVTICGTDKDAVDRILVVVERVLKIESRELPQPDPKEPQEPRPCGCSGS